MPATYRIADRAELAPVSALLEAANETPYDIGRVAEEKCFGPGFEGAPLVTVAIAAGDFAGVSVVCGTHLRLLAVHPRMRGQGIGSELLRRAERQSPRRLVAGGEAGNYFVPGILETDGQTRRFFERRGFREDDTALNLEVDLVANDKLARTESAPEVQRVSREEGDSVLAFVRQHFGAKWAFEITPALERPQPTAFIARIGGEIAGFVAHEANNCGLGTFGPTGVAPHARGAGVGRKLLLESLADLRQLGFDKAIIPWVSSAEFYARACNARAAHRFLGFSK